MALLVGDIGGTSGKWALISGTDVNWFETCGYNPVSHTKDRLGRLIAELGAKLDQSNEINLFYYGAGTGHLKNALAIENALLKNLPLHSIQVSSDMLAGARALCGNEQGVVCILGTGSNVCHYDGTGIDYQGATLGYPLGDEGSGTDIGRRLVRSYYYGLMPDKLKKTFNNHLPPNRYDFLRLFKKSTSPNKYLASFVRLIADDKEDDHVQKILQRAFGDFINYHLHKYEKNTKISFVGSIAFYFCTELEQSLDKYNLRMGEVVQEPLDRLVNYHKRESRV